MIELDRNSDGVQVFRITCQVQNGELIRLEAAIRATPGAPAFLSDDEGVVTLKAWYVHVLALQASGIPWSQRALLVALDLLADALRRAQLAGIGGQLGV